MFGTDEEVVEARNKVPEPGRTDCRFYQALLPQEPFDYRRLITERPEAIASIKTVTFTKVRMVSEGGAIYSAWRCERDGLLYL